MATRRSLVVVARDVPSARRARIVCGAIAGPLFIVAFTVIRRNRPGYDWQRHTVSSLAIGHRGWLQHANFLLAGVLYSVGARGLDRCPQRSIAPRAVPTLIAAAGIGLIGSGVFVTDPVDGFAPETDSAGPSSNAALTHTAPTGEGRMHNLSAVPIFAGIPVAGLASAVVAARRRDYCWASYSAASSLAMIGSFLLMGAAFGGRAHLGGKGGIFQRISIASGFGWLSSLSIRALVSPLRP